MDIKKKALGISLFGRIVVSIIGTMLLGFVAMRYVGKLQQERVFSQIAGEHVLQINKEIVEKTTKFMMPAVVLAESTSRFVEEKVVDVRNYAQVERYTMTILKIYPQLRAFYMGDKHGNFVMAKRKADGTFESKTIKAKNGVTVIKARDDKGRLMRRDEFQSVDYDPRKRPWYSGAKRKSERYWTPIYTFFSEDEYGITAAYPFSDSNRNFYGVFGVDIELNSISRYLPVKIQNTDISSFIMNDKFQFIAQSQSMDSMMDQTTLTDVSSLKSPSVNKALELYTRTGANHFTFISDRKKYVGSVIPFPQDFGRRWSIVLVAPMASILSTESDTVANAFLGLILLLLIFITAKIIANAVIKPIKLLQSDFRNVGSNQFNFRLTKSRIKELDILLQEFTKLKEKLKSKLNL